MIVSRHGIAMQAQKITPEKLTPGASKTLQPQRCGLIPITVIARDSFNFEKRCEFFVGTDDESLSIVAVRVCCEKRSSPTHKIDIGRTMPSVDARFEVDGKLQLRVNAEQRTARWRLRTEVADETVPGANLDMTGGAVGAVHEH